MAGAFRVLVTGSRTWDDELAVNVALFDAAVACRDAGHGHLIVVHGNARSGADKHAANWVRWAQGQQPAIKIAEESHPARWHEFGKAAGFRRNAEMVALGAYLCLAFVMPCSLPSCRKRPAHGSHGATHCMTLARNAGIEVKEIHGVV